MTAIRNLASARSARLGKEARSNIQIGERRLMQAGIPPSTIGQEMIAAGSAMVAESLGPCVAAQLLAAVTAQLTRAVKG